MTAGPHRRASSASERARRDTGPRRLVVVANANASGLGGRPGAERVVRVLAGLAGEVELRMTDSARELADVWAPAAGRRVVLVGGDGTLHDAANLAGPAPEVAIVPAGRANNVARSLGLPLELEAAAQLAATGTAAAVDLIEARSGDRRVVAVEGISVGFLALARARYTAPNSADLRAAAAAGASALAHFHPLDVRIRDHGTTESIHVGQLFVANMSCFGTGLRVAPQADPSDGLLDVVAIDVPGRRAIPAMLLRLRRGRHLGHHQVRSWRTDRITLSTRGRSPVVADTESLGSGPVEVRVLAGALPLVRPR